MSASNLAIVQDTNVNHSFISSYQCMIDCWGSGFDYRAYAEYALRIGKFVYSEIQYRMTSKAQADKINAYNEGKHHAHC
jgi:hypothetical protein